MTCMWPGATGYFQTFLLSCTAGLAGGAFAVKSLAQADGYVIRSPTPEER